MHVSENSAMKMRFFFICVVSEWIQSCERDYFSSFFCSLLLLDSVQSSKTENSTKLPSERNVPSSYAD